MKKKIFCLIPVKKNSKRLKNKNFLKFKKKSLLERVIFEAKKSKLFSEICISTDSEKAFKIAKKNNVSAPFIRPKKLCNDPATITDVMIHALKFYKSKKKFFDIAYVLSTTNPFYTHRDLKNAYNVFKRSKKDGVLSVSRFKDNPYNSWNIKNNILKPTFPKSKFKFTKSTECPKTYFSNGAFRIVKVKKFLNNKFFHNLKLTPYVMEQKKSIDIDTQLDYKLTKFIDRNG